MHQHQGGGYLPVASCCLSGTPNIQLASSHNIDLPGSWCPTFPTILVPFDPHFHSVVEMLHRSTWDIRRLEAFIILELFCCESHYGDSSDLLLSTAPSSDNYVLGLNKWIVLLVDKIHARILLPGVKYSSLAASRNFCIDLRYWMSSEPISGGKCT